MNSNILTKTRETPTQVSLGDRAERLENLKNAFAVRAPEKVRGAHVVLVDDVTTTGATLLEARGELLRAGARKVTCLAVAH